MATNNALFNLPYEQTAVASSLFAVPCVRILTSNRRHPRDTVSIIYSRITWRLLLFRFLPFALRQPTYGRLCQKSQLIPLRFIHQTSAELCLQPETLTVTASGFDRFTNKTPTKPWFYLQRRSPLQSGRFKTANSHFPVAFPTPTKPTPSNQTQWSVPVVPELLQRVRRHHQTNWRQ